MREESIMKGYFELYELQAGECKLCHCTDRTLFYEGDRLLCMDCSCKEASNRVRLARLDRMTRNWGR